MGYGIGKCFKGKISSRKHLLGSELNQLVEGNFLKEFLGCRGISSAVAYLILGHIENTPDQVDDEILVNQVNHITATKCRPR